MRFRIVSFFSRTVLLLIAAASLLFFSFAEAFASGSVASPSVFSSPADSALPAADDIFSNGQGSGLNATDPLLTILYNAATYGELYPCPT
jgi:hypothetical protein